MELYHQFFYYTITGLAQGAIFALFALGYTLVYGVLQLINFAHSEVFTFGTFTVAWVFMYVHGPESVTQGVLHTIPLLLLSLVAAMIVSALVALLVERWAYRPLIKKGAPKLMALISAIGASFALSQALGLRDHFARWFGLEDKLSNYVANAQNPYSNPVTIKPHPISWLRIGNYTITDIDLIVIISALVMMFGLQMVVSRTKMGRGMRAVAQDPESAALMGVNSTRVVRFTFLLGGLMAGVAATLYMLRIGTTSYTNGQVLGVEAFTAAVLGGIGNLRGALVGGLVLGVAENWGAALFGTQWLHVVAFVLLVLILLVRPQGILGEVLGKARA